jgi:hypothetical protein
MNSGTYMKSKAGRERGKKVPVFENITKTGT